jgi:hypothetical protein
MGNRPVSRPVEAQINTDTAKKYAITLSRTRASYVIYNDVDPDWSLDLFATDYKHTQKNSASELYRLSDRHLSAKFSANFCG